uniref:Uncharacterized protein n=1 Tax=Chlamydomonas leiostraca TaxID=1034604 RepID=A0A7S0S0J2_9CHLO|mmetsp:Transcript_37485/g.94625  ORF Transcript_37485/g.94625 Transcript_37485/m.94625 type:complete len:122 (+) Transcript_37485:190-555(+)|eukprot:CAMPEP_0202873876 /NCGR_PEP_ID=MMETSP1391-20130828/24216_1 /ASSEMBLY_ACC=CAM_ASM_000867 /TAXON_ID=1034604 /ORGANISM="Chlamydomonas leiostraca, Strain SAG 11-49" /LENGTH=121 /DNA_ID=CAMNT_0049555187 /DNA_START=161 /DNA_END=526 /DNA_ORIENTATION=-
MEQGSNEHLKTTPAEPNQHTSSSKGQEHATVAPAPAAEASLRSGSEEPVKSASTSKPAAIKPGGLVIAKNKPMVIKPAGGVKKAQKTDKPDGKKSAYLQAMEAYKSQSCSEKDVSGRPLVK